MTDFEDVYAALTARGVPEDRLPTPWTILSHVMDCTDYDALGEWIENYAALEALDVEETTELAESEEESEDGDETDPPKKRRPNYLMALPSVGGRAVKTDSEAESDEPESGS